MTRDTRRDDGNGSAVPPSVAYVQGLAAGVQGVLNGFDLAGLLRGAWRTGLVTAAADPATPAELAGRTGLRPDHVRRLLVALVAHEVVDPCDGDRYVVSDRWRPLLLDPAPQPITTLLRFGEARTRMVEDAVSGDRDYWSADLSDQAAYAMGVSIDPESVHGRELLGLSIGMDDELHRLLMKGGAYLELGCGAAGAMCALLTVYPRLRATGVELSSALVHVARARAQRLGLGDRMEVVLGDAGDLDRPDEFDLAFWSQSFFAAGTRAGALRVLHRSLRPGGVVTAPMLAEPTDDVTRLRTDEGREYAVDALLHGSWGVPERTGADLRQELADAGFVEPRVLDLPFSRVVRAVRP